jgi:hypothetical protein
MTLFEKMDASLHHGLHTAPEFLLSSAMVFLVRMVINLHDVNHHHHPLTNAAEVQKAIVGRQAAWTCRMGMSMHHAA